jgi:heptosyltransferase III
MPNKEISILVIRRDNIGDLILTTPLFAALRQKFPEAYLAALVNSYNCPAIEGNPHLDAVFAYTKGKHADGESIWRAYWRRIGLIWQLRRRRFDYVILPNGGFAGRALGLAKLIAPRHILGFVGSPPESGAIDMAVSHGDGGRLHEVEDIFRLLEPLGINPPIPGLTVVADPKRVALARAALPATVASGSGPLVALHLSARKAKQRWPVECFAALARRLHADCGARFLVFWSPGDENNPFHPGDDGKAARLLELLSDLPVAPVRTESLPELIAGLAMADRAILSDGGAMHVAAGLGKPLVCFFGNSSAERWRPWGVPYQLLQKPSRDVADISVDEVVDAFSRLG